jgi:protease-4
MREVKGVLIQINSPGGVVGPSQEIYAEIKKTRDVYKKPVVVSGSGLVASGAFYAAMGADKIVTNPGTLMGSIGVIMEFANLSKLYDWAKIQRYAIKTGAYKDTGSEYREMREDEKKLLNVLMQDVLLQFKTAISQGRNMPMDKVNQYADGRIFTGREAVELGFADQVGTLSDAIEIVGELSGLGKRPEVFEAPKERESLLNILMEGAETRLNLNPVESIKSSLKLMGQPLFILPGVWLE